MHLNNRPVFVEMYKYLFTSAEETSKKTGLKRADRFIIYNFRPEINH